MKNWMKGILIALASAAIGWAAYQGLAPAALPLSKFTPPGALLYLEAKDFSALLAEWNSSPQKQEWLKSDNYAVFSRSRLFLRLKEARQQFAAAAGLPPDMKLLSEAAGNQSALALYDIGKLEFLYITRLPSARSMESALWQARTKFETRNAAGIPFFIRRDAESQRTVAFAATDDYLILATREDLMAGALELVAGRTGRTIEGEQWWAEALAAAGAPGELRLVLNMEKIVATPYFRSYWIQQNITEMKQYGAAVCDLYRSASEYREERVLLPATEAKGETESAVTPSQSAQAVAEVVRLVPEDAGMYQALAAPSTEYALSLLQKKILAPRLGLAPAEKVAPKVALIGGEVGGASDLETRIDEAPVARIASTSPTELLQQILERAKLQAALHIESTRRSADGVFVRVQSAVVLVGSSDWDGEAVLAAFQGAIKPGLTTAELGVSWRPGSTARDSYYELDGLTPLLMVTRGHYLIISDDAETMTAVLARWNSKPNMEPAVFLAGFNHARERENFAKLTATLDRANAPAASEQEASREPQFFSENIASLSRTLAAVRAQSVVARESKNKVRETVTYQLVP